MKFFRRSKKARPTFVPRPMMDIHRSSRQETIHLRKKDVRVRVDLSGREIGGWFWKRRYAALPLLCLILLFIVAMKFTHASEADLSTSSCLGGWQNPSFATGAPDADPSVPETFTRSNSAVLPGGTAAEIFCGSFNGDIPNDTKPKSLVLHISWTMKHDAPAAEEVFATSTLVQTITPDTASTTPSDTSSTTSTDTTTEPAPQETPAPAPETTPAPLPEAVPETSPAQDATPASETPAASDTSAWKFVKTVLAADEDPLTSTTDTSAPAITETTTTPASSPDKFLSIRYTIDGVSWKELGKISDTDWQDASFVIPADEFPDWDSIKKIQVNIGTISTTGEMPAVYLDAMTLAVEYEDTQKPVAVQDGPDPVADGEVHYSRLPEGPSVTSPITINFSFTDWARNMDFIDIFNKQQNYWWIEIDANEKRYASPCYPSTTTSASYTFDLPKGDYTGVTINAASDLENCAKLFGGRTRSFNPVYGEPGNGGDTAVFTVN